MRRVRSAVWVGRAVLVAAVAADAQSLELRCGPAGRGHVEGDHCHCERGFTPQRVGTAMRCEPPPAHHDPAHGHRQPTEAPAPHGGSCPDGMTLIPRGSVAGHAVGAFCMDRTEVTVSAYGGCSGCTAAATTVDWPGISDADRTLYSQFCNGAREDRANHPVTCVDGSQAVAFCQARGARLPTEWEWQFSAQGTDGREYPWGNQAPGPTLLNACGSECVALGQRHGQTWRSMYTGNDGWESTAPVGSFPAGDSPFGLHDMAGNAWEWTSTVDGNNRVVRGGSWYGDDAARVRAAYRFTVAPALRSYGLGFRCARGVM